MKRKFCFDLCVSVDLFGGNIGVCVNFLFSFKVRGASAQGRNQPSSNIVVVMVGTRINYKNAKLLSNMQNYNLKNKKLTVTSNVNNCF